ncbi:MAG TPA: UbiD family decarboxylase [Burkholderiales bacterium]|nr:UbiD family decarboxylase [Burkholderiales bacterium]
MAEHPQSLRLFLAVLAERGAVRKIAKPASLDFEISAYLSLIGDGPALVFERIPRHSLRVLGNLLPSRDRIALGLGTPVAGLQRKLVAAIRAPIAPRWVTGAPCQALTIDRPDLASLPVPRFFEHETGPYITAAAIVARDPISGNGNLSFARLKPLGANRAFIGIAPNHHLAVFARRAAELGRSLPIAVTLGNHPAVLIAAALYLGLGEDELHVAGALLGEPVEVVRCGHAELGVPAHCEIVLEGTLKPAERVREGRVSEYHGLYEDYGDGYVVEFTRLTRRADAIFQVIQPGHAPEHVWIGGEAIAAGLAIRLSQSMPNLREVAVTPGGCGRMHAVVSLTAPRPGDARQAIFVASRAVNLIKRVIVVDDDVDPWDATQVEWATATRMLADRDLVVVPGAKTDRSDPLEDSGVVAKLGIDATRKAEYRDDWTLAAPPAAVVAKVKRELENP